MRRKLAKKVKQIGEKLQTLEREGDRGRADGMECVSIHVNSSSLVSALRKGDRRRKKEAARKERRKQRKNKKKLKKQSDGIG